MKKDSRHAKVREIFNAIVRSFPLQYHRNTLAFPQRRSNTSKLIFFDKEDLSHPLFSSPSHTRPAWELKASA
eukprot:758843-Hanusia_phi.AAC.2